MDNHPQTLTELELQVLNTLQDNDEGEGSVYLDNCCFTKAEIGALGSLEKKGFYEPAKGEYAGAFGYVDVIAAGAELHSRKQDK